jgi:UDP-glucuronate 4-epimerase
MRKSVEGARLRVSRWMIGRKGNSSVALLVTGAMGHVGREVVRQAAAAGVAVVAQYRTTYRDADARDVGSNVRWVSCDLSDAGAVERLCEMHSIDSCIHSAAVPNEKYARPQPLVAINANIGATAHLLDMARRQSWRRFLAVSTGSVFQNATDPAKPILEDAPPAGTNIYSTTKLCAELLTEMYRSQFGLSSAVVRISWVYGPPLVTDDPPRGPIPAFLHAALTGRPIRLPSGGDFAASFTYVGDVAAGLIAAWRSEKLNHSVYHLGSGENYSARRVADAVRAAVPDAEIELGAGTEPWTTHTRMRGPLGGNRLRDDAGFLIGHSLEDGVRAYAEWMRANPGLLA